MWWRSLLAVAVVMLLAGALLLLREETQFRPSPAALASRTDVVSVPDLHPGGDPTGVMPSPQLQTHEEMTASDVAEGERLYNWFNCSGCHFKGGGGIGPALMDDKWIYGGAPANIYSSILEGRPNGMPSFRGKIPDQQVWQIVAYVRSMSANVPVYARPGREDHMSAKPPESMAPHQTPKQGTTKPSDPKATTP